MAELTRPIGIPSDIGVTLVHTVARARGRKAGFDQLYWI